MKQNNEQPQCQQCPKLAGSIFCDLKPDELNILNNSKHYSTYKINKTIFEEGKLPLAIHCVCKGKFKLSKVDVYGKEHIIGLKNEGDLLGYIGMLNGDNYSCSAIALEESSTCLIPKEVFLKLIDTNHDVSKKLNKVFALELYNVNQKKTNIIHKHLREKIAEALLDIIETNEFETDGATIKGLLKQKDIAKMAGTSHESISRFFAEFKKDKIIEIDGRKIKILNYKELEKIANI